MNKHIEIGSTDIELIDGDRGKNYPHQNELLPEGDCVFLSANNVTIDGFKFDSVVYITAEKDRALRNGKIQRGDIVITTRGTVGNVAYYDQRIPYDDVRINSGMLIVRCHEQIKSEFLYYVLRGTEFQQQIKQMQTGTAQPQLPKSHFVKMKIVVPNAETQEKIAKVLRIIDKKIENNKCINENLLEQALAVYKAWFCEYVLSDGIRPESWSNTTIEELSTLVTRGVAPKYDDNSDQIVLNQKCIRDHTIDLSLARRHLPKKINEKWITKGDLLINSTGTGTLGRVAQVWFDANNMTVDSHVTIVRPKDSILQGYLGFWGLSHESEIEAQHTGSTGQTELPRDRVKSMELPQPDEDTLRKFNELIIPLTSAIVSNQEENARLSQIRDALLPKLMSGEIDVSDLGI